jgi:DUF1016 N-terminal domain
MKSELIPADYAQWLESLKSRISAARSRAALAVNAELIQLYHGIGRDILERQTRHGWGSKVVTRVADDLKAAFPDMKGFSASNVKYMRYFAEHCPDGQFGQQPADQIAVVPRCHFADQGSTTRPRVVRRPRHSAKLIAPDAGTEHRNQATYAPRRGDYQFRPATASAGFCAGAGNAERPVSVRLPRPC